MRHITTQTSGPLLSHPEKSQPEKNPLLPRNSREMMLAK